MAASVSTRSMQDRVVSFTALDGKACNLIHVRGARTPTKGPVLLVHGAGVRANIFRPPVRTTVVDLLLDAGYDVWMENWRASIDLPENRWTLDQAALFDHPAAVDKVIAETGAEEVRAIVHCQGSTSFTMSAVAGLLPRVTTVVTNAISLHPVVPMATWLKLGFAVPLMARLTPFINPQWGLHPPHALARALNGFVRLTHHECDNIVCRWSSFAYGVGFPTLWRHENLDERTHDWISDEFAAVPLAFFNQIRRCVAAGRLVAFDRPAELPADLTAQPPATQARFAFFAGERNRCFLPEGQRRSHAWFDSHRPGYHSLHIVPGYAHLDVFIGRNAHRDVLPLMVEELDRPN
jgi:pimeloyl-ACP methyl ester carboxylesterase